MVSHLYRKVAKDEVEEALYLLLIFEDSLASGGEDLTLFDDLCIAYCKRFGYSTLVDVRYRTINNFTYQRKVITAMDE